MKKLKYEILRKNIPGIVLYTPGQYWYDKDFSLIPWSGTTPPSIGTIVMDSSWYSDITYAIGETTHYDGEIYKSLLGSNLNKVPSTQTSYWVKINKYDRINTEQGKYYTWNGSSWALTTKANAYDDHNLPLFLDAKADELGVMVGFDGDIEQTEQLCNFVYKSTGGNVLSVYNTASTNPLKRIVDASFVINWGDGSSTQSIGILSGLTKTYSTSGTKSVSITMTAPWKTQTVTKQIKLPLTSNNPTDLATFTFSGATLPYFNVSDDYLENGRTQDYGNTYDYTQTPYTGATFLALGKSRKIEKKLYGGSTYSGVTGTTITIEGATYNCDRYVIDGLTYLDLSDGTTYITGNTSSFVSESEFTKKLTRNEHYLGFVSDPVVYSDIFVERGKMGVAEFNLRLGEIDNIGELDIYGNGFFDVKKQ
jgi:hypothetical protein